MKTLEWLGRSKKDLIVFPDDVKEEITYALYLAQQGEYHEKTKRFRGYGSGVYEIAIRHDKNAYRAVYILSAGDTIYVVHCFQKKSKRGIKTPREELEVIKQRLKQLKLQKLDR